MRVCSSRSQHRKALRAPAAGELLHSRIREITPNYQTDHVYAVRSSYLLTDPVEDVQGSRFFVSMTGLVSYSALKAVDTAIDHQRMRPQCVRYRSQRGMARATTPAFRLQTSIVEKSLLRR